jgi:putative hemolysin
MTLIIVLIILVTLSAYFSASETAFSTLNRIRIKNLASTNKRAALTLSLYEDYDKILSTLLIGNNIVNIASASIATIVFTQYFTKNGVTISTVVMTIIVLIFGEISPKSIAKENAENFAMFSAPFLKFFTIILSPFNYAFMGLKVLLSKIFKSSDEKGFTEEELITIINEAENEGGIDKHESELIRSAIEFNDLDVIDIITPRVDVAAVKSDISPDEVLKAFEESGFSRMPVYDDDIDNIIGVINEKDFHKNYKNLTDIKSIIKPILYTTPTTKISTLLRQLQIQKTHIAVVVDEYGGTQGIVTLEDILEELVGEIWDEHDEVIEEFKKIDEGRYRILCTVNLDDMFKTFHINKNSKEYISSTVSGWVVEELGKIPSVGDSFVFENLEVTVIQTDLKRVMEIEVKVLNDENKEKAVKK